MAKQGGARLIGFKIRDEIESTVKPNPYFDTMLGMSTLDVSQGMMELTPHWKEKGYYVRAKSIDPVHQNGHQFIETYIEVKMPQYDRDAQRIMKDLLHSYTHFIDFKSSTSESFNYKRKGTPIISAMIKNPTNKSKRDDEVIAIRKEDKLVEPNAKRPRIASPKQSPRPKKVTIRQRYGAIFGHVKKPTANRTRRQKRHRSI